MCRRGLALFHRDFQEFGYPELIFRCKGGKNANLCGLLYNATQGSWKVCEIRLFSALVLFLAKRNCRLFFPMSRSHSATFNVVGSACCSHHIWWESWGLWGAHTTWLVGLRSVHATRLSISRLRQLPDSVLGLLVSKAHTRSDAGNVLTRCPGRCFPSHTWTRSRKEMLLCREKTKRNLHPLFSAAPLGCFHVPRQPPRVWSLIGWSSFYIFPTWLDN